jgi:large subunit ribosomal protein L25
VKLAKAHGVEALLPPGRKSTAFKEQRVLEQGLRVRGTGEGQKVKGHKWERRMGAKLDVRRKAMENMPEMIREWKQRGHGRGWKKYPK